MAGINIYEPYTWLNVDIGDIDGLHIGDEYK